MNYSNKKLGKLVIKQSTEYIVMSKINLMKHNRKSNVETPANIAGKIVVYT